MALFKTDRKNISSDIGYLLIDRKLEVQGVTSSVLRMLGVDVNKFTMRAITGTRLDKLANYLVNAACLDDLVEKTRGIEIEWVIPQVDNSYRKKASIISTTSSNNAPYDQMRTFQKYAKKSYLFQTQAEFIHMGRHNNIGWYVKIVFDGGMSQFSKRTGDMRLSTKFNPKVLQPLF